VSDTSSTGHTMQLLLVPADNILHMFAYISP